MANKPLESVTNISEANIWDSDVSVVLSQAGIWRDIVSSVFRNAISKALFKSEARPPVDDDRVSGQSAAFWDSENSKLYLSFDGSGWLLISTGGDVSNIRIGVHRHLGSWTYRSAGIADVAQYSTSETTLTIHTSNGNSEDKTQEILDFAAGDNVQIDEINTFIVSGSPVRETFSGSGYVYSIAGQWFTPHSQLAFEGNAGQPQSADIYYIKRQNVLGQNAPSPKSVLQVADDFSLNWVYTPYEKIWSASSGRVVNTSSSNYTLLPNKQFSDYRDISVIYDNQGSTTIAVEGRNELSATFPAQKFGVGNLVQVHTMAYWKQLTVVSDTVFRIAQGISTHLGIREIWGGR